METAPWEPRWAPLRDILSWLLILLGLAGNLIGLIVIQKVKIGFPATRFLLHLQFLWDGVGCIIVAIYWITFHLNLSLNTIKGPAFAYCWANLFPFLIITTLSSVNLVLLTADRFWSIVLFRTYPRDSKCYQIALFGISFVYAGSLASTCFVVAYYDTNIAILDAYNVQMFRKVYWILLFVFAYLIPACGVTAMQTKILLVLRRLVSNSGSRNLSFHLSDPLTGTTTARSVRTASVGVGVILINFILARMYCHLEYVLSSYGLMKMILKGGWQNYCIFLYTTNFVVDPFALILTSTMVRTWILGKLISLMAKGRRFVSKCFGRQ
ncbi:hypothetical protein FBUS_07907 [Fasciolopsis buskii]|uniref:G-protein coupled receptors family 1 profile domain-containing protein n=1 Tax=Fasciolopsis buskii TaxID=27845 RepID=A0A8E0S490_9TREM|nr:hypothetical protein FBUS_07907 [Fasciolopsis buski]